MRNTLSVWYWDNTTVPARIIYKGRVTLGKSSEDFALIEKQPKVKSWPFTEKPPAYVDNATWIRPKLVCNGRFHGAKP